MSTPCPSCHGPMVPLFSSLFCPRDCDRRTAAVVPTGVPPGTFEDGSVWTLKSGEQVLWRDADHPPSPGDRAWFFQSGIGHTISGLPETICKMWVAKGGFNAAWHGGLVASVDRDPAVRAP